MLLLMRFFGLLAFTAVAAYAITVTPALKWAFVLIAMLPVSLYNRTVLSADGTPASELEEPVAGKPGCNCLSAAGDRGSQAGARTD
jgi:hypothetical protein